MILKTAANYNDEGGYIEAWKNSDGTTEVKLIPKNGGGNEGKNGIKSISISPAITTTPALNSLVPIYWEDLPTNPPLPEGIKQYNASLLGGFTAEAVYKATFTPTSDWYVDGNGKGEPSVVDGYVEDGHLIFEATAAETQEPSFEGGDKSFSIFISIGE